MSFMNSVRNESSLYNFLDDRKKSKDTLHPDKKPDLRYVNLPTKTFRIVQKSYCKSVDKIDR